MNPITQQVIEFLTNPDLPFGAEEDVLLLNDPKLLRAHVASLLQEHPDILGKQNSQSLWASLGEADWPFVAQEFNARVALAANFFEADTHAD